MEKSKKRASSHFLLPGKSNWYECWTQNGNGKGQFKQRQHLPEQWSSNPVL